MVNIIGIVGLIIFYLFVVFNNHEKPRKAVVITPIEVAKPVVAESTEEVPVVEAPKATLPELQPMDPVNLARGKEVWTTVCIKCHNKDPNIKGAIGPETVDAPVLIVQYKILNGRYPEVLPEGFVPKRKTNAMQKQPKYAKDAASIHAYIQSLKK